MGYANKDLMLQLETAKRRGDKILAGTLAHRVKTTQATCPHPIKDRICKQVDKVTEELRPGDTYVMCARCSGPVHHSRGDSTSGQRMLLAGLPLGEVMVPDPTWRPDPTKQPSEQEPRAIRLADLLGVKEPTSSTLPAPPSASPPASKVPASPVAPAQKAPVQAKPEDQF
jgi:hypothetical protein